MAQTNQPAVTRFWLHPTGARVQLADGIQAVVTAKLVNAGTADAFWSLAFDRELAEANEWLVGAILAGDTSDARFAGWDESHDDAATKADAHWDAMRGDGRAA